MLTKNELFDYTGSLIKYFERTVVKLKQVHDKSTAIAALAEPMSVLEEETEFYQTTVETALDDGDLIKAKLCVSTLKFLHSIHRHLDVNLVLLRGHS